MNPAIECKNVFKKYAQQSVLNDISLKVPEASLFFLLGPSGCGKTTLLRIIAGLETEDSGQILMYNQQISNLAPDRRGVGLVFQNYALWPHLNVYQHLEFGLKNSRLSRQEIDQRISSVLEMLQIKQLISRLPEQLSGGQQQRLSLARALALRPKVLLLDEPLSNLDPNLREEMRSELKQLQRELGLTFIYVTHDRTEALAIGDKLAFMSKGKIVQQGSATDLYFQPESQLVASFLGDINLFDILSYTEKGFQFACGTYKSSRQISDIKAYKIAVRPEEIIHTSVSACDYKLKANIQSVVPLGYACQLNLKLLCGHVLKTQFPMSEVLKFKEGQHIEVGFNQQDIKLVKADL